MKYYLTLLLLIVSIASYSEVRSVWVLPWDITSPESIDTMIQTAVESNLNEIMVEVRYRSDALYDTSIAAALFPNPEPRSYILPNNGFDPLSYIISKAHAEKLLVHAWVIVFNATPLEPSLVAKNYIYTEHRDWLTRNENGNTHNGNSQFGYFIDPGVPEVQDYLIGVLSNLVAGYPELDGLHLDYIRYPDIHLGYHPVSVMRYLEYCRQNGDITYNEWRIMQVSTFVQRVNAQVKSINPYLILSAAVFADIADANVAYAQDWTSWLQQGFVDRIYPMAYSVKFNTYKQQLERMKLVGKDDKIIMGLRAWDEGGRSLAISGGAAYNVSDIASRISYARQQGFGGIALFSYPGLKVGSAWKQLTKLSYPYKILQVIPLKTTELIDMPDSWISELQGAQTTYSPKSAVFSVHSEADEYIIDIDVPSEGRWRWEISNDELLYYRYRYYLEGQNRDYWNGSLNSRADLAEVHLIEPGSYNVRLFREDTEDSYTSPITIEGLAKP
ncbi:MAG: family 10 glycosylhydrolase [Candidatus Cloacimonetes bacterium]|nr:family 10 glycosylhydrolase [Candidatus Cloacimonadota bacterium]